MPLRARPTLFFVACPAWGDPLAELLPREPRPPELADAAAPQRRPAPPRLITPGSRRCLPGTVTAGIWIDNQEPQRLAASTLDADLTRAIGDLRDPRERARCWSASRPPHHGRIDSRLLAIVLLGLVVVCLVATLLGSVLARLVSRPLGELAAQARAIARGTSPGPRRRL